MRLPWIGLAGMFVLAGCVGRIGDVPGTDSGSPVDSESDTGNVTDTGPVDVAHDTGGCGPGLTSCGGTCVNVSTSTANCGACAHACASGQVCSAGVCSSTCTGTMCGSVCTNTQTDPANCGACGHACASGQMCASGACNCPAGQMSCGGSCVDTTSNNANCGSCGHACPSGQTCSGGNCACPSGQMACGSACVNTTSDNNNCGACGRVCMSGQTCTGGMCTGGTACPGPPAGVSADAAAALMRENQVRTAMGVGCATMVTTINTSAQRHCGYYLANTSNMTCIANPHVEVSGCAMYVAAQFWERMSAAGYTGSPAFEDMHFIGNGASAVQGWIDSIWHRTPVLSPWVHDIGYGGGGGMPCDTMDFGTGAALGNNVVATYPYPNQTGVPTSFDGNYEGPPPPAPTSGWPSGYPIHIYLRGGSVTTHTLTVAGSSTPIAHMWLTPSDPRSMGLLNDEYVMYANTPLTAGTQYRVQIVGSNGGGAVNLDWTFTTM